MVDDDEIIDDIDVNEDLAAPPAAKPSLKEVWETNPALKIAAVVLGVVVLLGVYMISSSGSNDEELKSMMRVGDTSTVKQIPGQKELDPAYRKALEDVNKKEAEIAAESGGSALPTPIGPAKVSGLEIEMPEMPKVDPLAEWRKATEARRAAVEKEAKPEEEPPPPEVVPMVQPIRPQQQGPQKDPNAAKALAEQMRVILAAQEPAAARNGILTARHSAFSEQEKRFREAGTKSSSGLSKSTLSGSASASSSSSAARSSGKLQIKTIVSAGSVAYAQTLNALNSDIQGPVMAQVLSGPFAGGKALGSIEVKDEYMVITFSMIVKDNISYKINAIALDEKTTLAGQATDVDNHYFVRIILPAAAKFVEGYGSAVAQSATTATATSGGGSTTSQPKPSSKESLYRGLQEASGSVGKMLDEGAKRPITVKIASGTTMGILFIDTVTTGDAGI